MTDPWFAVLMLLLGWLFGLLGPEIVYRIRTKRRMKAIERGVLAELKDVGVRIGIGSQRIDMVLDKFTRASVSRMYEIYSKLGRGPRNAKALEVQAQMLKWTDKEFAAVADAKRHETHGAGGGIGLRKVRMPFIDSKIAELELFGDERMAQLLDLRAQLEQYHELVDDARHYMNLTFELTGVPLERATGNLKIAYESAGKKADNITTRIIEFIEGRAPSTEKD